MTETDKAETAQVRRAHAIRCVRALLGGGMLGVIPAFCAGGITSTITMIASDDGEMTNGICMWASIVAALTWTVGSAVIARLLYRSEDTNRYRVAVIAHSDSDEGGLGRRSAALHATIGVQHLSASLGS